MCKETRNEETTQIYCMEIMQIMVLFHPPPGTGGQCIAVNMLPEEISLKKFQRKDYMEHNEGDF